jgi:hypothetical protein
MRADDTATRRDVLSMRRLVTDAGNVRFDTTETEDGHGDRGWALALCVAAAGGVTRSATTKIPESVTSRARAALGGGDSRRVRLG